MHAVLNIYESNPVGGPVLRMVVVDLTNKRIEVYGNLEHSYLLREHSPYKCDQWEDEK